MTKLITSLEELKEIRSALDKDDAKPLVSFVPTMGALHDGHLALIKEAKDRESICFVSIFVNPLQFGPSEDFDSYPRTLEEDLLKCKEFGADYVFAPESGDIYPEGKSKKTKANPFLANRLCGLSRPGHFDGVCTVLKRLFELVQPNFSIFGEKDYQQFLVVKEMTERLDLGVDIIPYPTIREDNGLAMSSRNKYLTKKDFEHSGKLYQELVFIRNKIKELGIDKLNSNDKNYIGNLKSADKVINDSKAKLSSLGFKTEYLEIFEDRIFLAASVGKTRLIDNIKL